jgi:hypothetical protein
LRASERESFEAKLNSAIDRLNSKCSADRDFFVCEISRLKSECGRFSVEESIRSLKSSEVWADYESQIAMNPELRISGMLRSWALNRGDISLIDKISEIRRTAPTADFRVVFKSLKSNCPDISVNEVVVCFREVFPELKIDEMMSLIHELFTGLRTNEVAALVRKSFAGFGVEDVISLIGKLVSKL